MVPKEEDYLDAEFKIQHKPIARDLSPRVQNNSLKNVRNTVQLEDNTMNFKKHPMLLDSDEEISLVQTENFRVKDLPKEPESPEILSDNEDNLEAGEDKENYLEKIH